MIVSPPRKYRPGFTLIEMLVLIAVTSVICALATSLILTMFRAEQAQTRDADERRAIQRLGDQFRRDVHAASATATFEMTDDVLLRLPLGSDVEVTYRRTGPTIVREKHQGGAVVYHDTFPVSDRWQVSIEPMEPREPKKLETPAGLMRLSLVRAAAAQPSPAPERWQFEATRGSDHRHNTRAEPTE